MIELKYERVEIENMLEVCHIKDANGENGYSEGIYADRVALNGFYSLVFQLNHLSLNIYSQPPIYF